MTTTTTTTDWAQIQKVFGKQDACPNCGYCKYCGRGGYQTYPYTPQPYYPTYPWQQPWIHWTISSGGTSC